MKKHTISFIFPLLTTILLVVIFDSNIGRVPAIGLSFNPYRGFLQNSVQQDITRTLPRNGHKFSVAFDSHHIPHIFANKSGDLSFAQGYVTATDRLWQMDFLSRVSAGRLAEILGPDFLEHDRLQRRMGIPYAARRSLAFIESNPSTKKLLDNYTAGVNARIAELQDQDVPVEYKLLGYKPEAWTNLKSVLILKYMAFMLSGYEEDFQMSNVFAILGEDTLKKLFPDYKLEMDENRSYTFTNLTEQTPFTKRCNSSFLEGNSFSNSKRFNPRLGSNSWAIAPSKSLSSKAILCNDPHLNLNFPSIWYELQLSWKGRFVYGYSIPGTPGIIIGYNDHIAWGTTNGAVDVKNWYKLTFNEEYTHYKVRNKWLEINKTIETIRIKGQKAINDTIKTTIYGPIVYDNSFIGTDNNNLAALSWTIFEPSNEFETFIELNRAKDYADFKKAIEHYKCPVQNFTYADCKGNIALHHQGTIFTSDGDFGKFILDGKNGKPTTLSVSSILPPIWNPEIGFVSSANNNPNQKENTNKYVDGYYSEQRHLRLQQLLSSKKRYSVLDMMHMQSDNKNQFMIMALPHLLKLTKSSSFYKKKIQQWNLSFDKKNPWPLFTEQWWNMIKYDTWDELYQYDFITRLPDDAVLLELIKTEPNNPFFDKISTPKKETASDLITATFNEVAKKFHRRKNRVWGDANVVNVNHLTNIPVLGKSFNASGHPDALNALSDNWGPSLRSIVVMSKNPIGYGITSGGASGNPFSYYYSDDFKKWKRNQYRRHLVFDSFEAAKKHSLYFWISK